jgi:hypothetical protein
MAYKALVLIQKYSHIFRNDLAKDPADIPLHLSCKSICRNGDPKIVTSTRAVFCQSKRRRLGRLISPAQNIIERSDAITTQVLLTNKPTVLRDSVIDYRKLNDCTESRRGRCLTLNKCLLD